MTWPVAFVLTLILETPIALLVMRRGLRADLPWILLANGISHPTLWFVLFPRFDDYWTFLVVGEAAVFTFEAIVYSLALRHWRSIAASVSANAFSMGVGLLITAWLAA